MDRADAGNQGAGMGGGIYFFYSTASAPILRNTIIADNYRGSGTITEDDIVSPVGMPVNSSNSFNLIGTGDSSSGLTDGTNNNQVGVANPGLAPLVNNGGPTETHALLAGSPAIDQGDDFYGNTARPDQRSFARPLDFPSIPNAAGGGNVRSSIR